jgi:hypothetical protein
MQSARLSFFAIVFSIAVMSNASANQAINSTEILLSAMSPFEDMIEFVLAGSDSGVSKAVAEADRLAANIKSVLPNPMAGRFDALMAVHHNAAVDNHKLASSAVDVVFMIDNLQAQDLEEPKEVSLLDCAGFKLRVLVHIRAV